MDKRKKMFQVNGKPFFVLGAQAGTNNTYFREDLKDFWKCASAMRINTAELQVFWEMIEPKENIYDFSQIDMLIDECRRNRVKLIVMWFGTWKNAAMKYVPAYVKKDRDRFWRMRNREGTEFNVLSPNCEETLKADCRAFLKLVEHIKEIDEKEQTVIGIQIQNESGVAYGDTLRDHHEIADAMFRRPVPEQLVRYITERPGCDIYRIWEKNGAKKDGDWEALFGRDAEEIFTAWGIASFINVEAKAAKRIYDLPMFVNVAMMESGFQIPIVNYFSCGPVQKLIEVWKCAGPDIDFLAPDIYERTFSHVNRDCSNYDREDNVLYIPEAYSYSCCNWVPFAAIGYHDCIGFSCMKKCYSIVADDGSISEERSAYVQAMRDISYVAPLLARYYAAGRIFAVVQESEYMTEQLVALDGWDALATFQWYDSENNACGIPQNRLERGAGLIIQTGENEFYLVGSNFNVEFHQHQPANVIWPERLFPKRAGDIGYFSVEEGIFDEHESFQVFNRRNGDSSDYGIAMLPKTKVVRVVLEKRR